MVPRPIHGRRRRTSVITGALLFLIATLTTFVPAAAEETPATVRVTADISGGSARVVVTHSRSIAHAVTLSRQRLDVVYTEPVRIEPSSKDLGDTILLGWAQDGDRTLALLLGPDYDRYESFELKNPSRLVFDVLGKRPSADVTPVAVPRETERKTIIVIDPGHGGIENGAVGSTGLREKDVALDLSRRLKGVLQVDPDVSVVLTRDDDRHLALDERTAIANHNRAHLFISVHVNSSRRKGARGSETYFLSTEATDDEARTLAALENRAYDADEPLAIKVEGQEKKKEALELILWDLAQNQYLAESSRLAESVQNELNALAGTRNRGVRQAPFRVLMGATMPAILVEVGFISNKDEEELLRSPSYRDRVVKAIGRAVNGFLQGRQRLSQPGSGSVSGAARP